MPPPHDDEALPLSRLRRTPEEVLLTRRGVIAAGAATAALLGAQLLTPSSARALQVAPGGMYYPTDPWRYNGLPGTRYRDPRDDNNDGIPDRYHMGIDAQGSRGQAIYATLGGRVIGGGWTPSGGFGYHVKIDHGGGFTTLSAHFDGAPTVAPNQTVQAGQQIGRMGNSQNGPTSRLAVHLHFEVIRDGAHVNPLDFLNGTLGSFTPGDPNTPPPPPKTLEEDEMLFLKAESNGSEGLAKAGEFYRRVEGSWIGVASLEASVLVYALVDRGALVAPFGGNDVELMFATDGLWEQSTLTGSVSSSRGPLTGRGYRTGRRIYPGAPGRLGQWHYPHEITTATP